MPAVFAWLLLPQSWGDEDVPAVLEALAEQLRNDMVVLSSWELYRKEVLSGSLDWGPMHTSDAFWRQNVERFEDKDFQVRWLECSCSMGRQHVQLLCLTCRGGDFQQMLGSVTWPQVMLFLRTTTTLVPIATI